METRDKIVGTLFLVLGSLLVVAAFRPELWLRASGFTLFITLSPILFVTGAYHFATSHDRAEKLSQQLAGASPLRRLWLPARFYTSRNLVWQFRMMGGMLITAGMMTAFFAFLMHRWGF
jgi:hypothetical protein